MHHLLLVYPRDLASKPEDARSQTPPCFPRVCGYPFLEMGQPRLRNTKFPCLRHTFSAVELGEAEKFLRGPWRVKVRVAMTPKLERLVTYLL